MWPKKTPERIFKVFTCLSFPNTLTYFACFNVVIAYSFKQISVAASQTQAWLKHLLLWCLNAAKAWSVGLLPPSVCIFFSFSKLCNIRMSGMVVHFIIFHFHLVILLKLFFKLLFVVFQTTNSDLRDVASKSHQLLLKLFWPFTFIEIYQI